MSRNAVTHLTDETRSLRTLSEVVTWCLMAQPPAEITAVIHQDEFTLDVVVSTGSRWLVFDTT